MPGLESEVSGRLQWFKRALTKVEDQFPGAGKGGMESTSWRPAKARPTMAAKIERPRK